MLGQRVVAIYSLVLAASAVAVGRADNTETLTRLNAALPNKWVAVTVVAHPSQLLVEHAEIIKPFDLGMSEQARLIVTAISGLNGIDAEGDFVVGLCYTSEKKIRPFVLLPSPAPNELIESLEGDPNLEQPPLNFGGEQLVAVRRDGWLALCDSEVVDQFAMNNTSPLPRLGNTLTCSVEPTVWYQLASTAAELREADSRWYYRSRRVLSPGSRIPRNVEALTDLLLAAKPIADHLSESRTALCATIDLPNDDSPIGAASKFTLVLTQRGDLSSDDDASSTAIPPQVASDHEAIADARLALPPVWLRWALKNYLISGKVWSEEYILQMDRSRFYDDYIAASVAVADQVASISFLAVLPNEQQPPMSNQVAIIACDDPVAWLVSLEKAVSIWNDMATNEMRRTKFILEKSNVKVAGIEATRYAVDLQSAFLTNDVPDVKVLMTKLFGEGGRLTYTLVPLDDRRVLVSQMADNVTARLVEIAKQPAAGSTEESSLVAKFSLHNYRRWQAQQYAIEFADAKYGPKIQPIECKDLIEISASGDAQTLTLTATASRKLLAEWMTSKSRKGK